MGSHEESAVITKLVRTLMLIAIMIMILLISDNGSSSVRAMSLCNVTEEGLNACRPSVTAGNPLPPTPECCDAVSVADLKCLCSYKNSLMLPSLGIDPDLALALPGKCNVPAPTDCE